MKMKVWERIAVIVTIVLVIAGALVLLFAVFNAAEAQAVLDAADDAPKPQSVRTFIAHDIHGEPHIILDKSGIGGGMICLDCCAQGEDDGVKK